MELDKLDLINDYNSFSFTRQYLQERKIKVYLDSIDYYALRFLNIKEVGVDLVKLFWLDSYVDNEGTLTTEMVLETIKNLTQTLGEDKVALARCDFAKALEL